MSPDVFARDGKYLMLALDHRGSFKKFLNPRDPDAVDSQTIIARKREIIEVLGSAPSGILLDIEYGIYARRGLSHTPPYLLAMEETGYEEEGENRHTKVIYMASTIRAKGASGAKLLLFMHGDGGEGDNTQIIVAREALCNARIYSLPFFLEIVIYGALRSEIGRSTLSAMRHLKAEGINPSVWKLEYPGSREECSHITNEAGKTPWILLSRGVLFEQFVTEVAVAASAGAKGFLVGRSLWQDVLRGIQSERQERLRVLPLRFERLALAVG